ncbi:hypothetical protein COV24_00675 [candidate division WWE3 bacterium CG10_big_fil_rev_8_21_14_0_10_32_10]|uniref:Uncharacterized protein n=1 Tax=candidate division WWE3 bacterium CG10_big_fil_rev_8_21_14_0_10_32_10 TaxID=1975090 RepID=A0A2H0RDC9_UNCKA|nr:MAG: hypothetical protein COV24_00675 [candidate division WWE3 bacterium CG10_big_fil_rev_8_21_14_0_10_32_10]
MPNSKTFHNISVILGLIFLISSIYTALILENIHFYTSFVFGSWLVLDYIDYKINNTSILTYFFNHKHRITFFIFFIISTLFCYIVDYFFGVKLFKMWTWVNYKTVHFIRMYLFMNISFILGMYELYRIYKSLFRGKIPDKHIFILKTPYNSKTKIYIFLLLFGILFLLLPLNIYLLNLIYLYEYVMLLPFISLILISDSITYLTGGKPILEDLIRFSLLNTSSLGATVLSAVIITEGLNLWGKEWVYTKMPFYNIKINNIPLAVLVGWIPLIIGCLSIVNMVKHLDYLRTKKQVLSL